MLEWYWQTEKETRIPKSNGLLQEKISIAKRNKLKYSMFGDNFYFHCPKCNVAQFYTMSSALNHCSSPEDID